MKRCTMLFTLSVLALPAAGGLPADGQDRQLPEVSWKAAAAHVGEECVVVGRVVMTKNIGSRCFLNFHHDYRTHFTVIIERESFDRFPEPPETMYADKHVKVTGKVIEYRGKPEIIVTGPDRHATRVTGPSLADPGLTVFRRRDRENAARSPCQAASLRRDRHHCIVQCGQPLRRP